MNREVIRKLRIEEGGKLRILHPPASFILGEKDLPNVVFLATKKTLASSVLCFVDQLENLDDDVNAACEGIDDNVNLTLALPKDIYLLLSPRHTAIRKLLDENFRMIAHFQLMPGYKAIRFSRRLSQGKTSRIGLDELERSSERIRARYTQLA